MKDRTREAVFNLVGPEVVGTHVWDLFAGTGAMALEALSRGAQRATLIERHIPTAKLIQQNVADLQLEDRVVVQRADTFIWIRNALVPDRQAEWPVEPWLVFCCPPYAFYEDRQAAIHEMLTCLKDAAPADSLIVVEAERPFDFETLWPAKWSVRDYHPATVGIYRKLGT